MQEGRLTEANECKTVSEVERGLQCRAAGLVGGDEGGMEAGATSKEAGGVYLSRPSPQVTECVVQVWPCKMSEANAANQRCCAGQ